MQAKTAVSYEFGHIYRRNPLWETSFFVQRIIPAHCLRSLWKPSLRLPRGTFKTLTNIYHGAFCENN